MNRRTRAQKVLLAKENRTVPICNVFTGFKPSVMSAWFLQKITRRRSSVGI